MSRNALRVLAVCQAATLSGVCACWVAALGDISPAEQQRTVLSGCALLGLGSVINVSVAVLYDHARSLTMSERQRREAFARAAAAADDRKLLDLLAWHKAVATPTPAELREAGANVAALEAECRRRGLSP